MSRQLSLLLAAVALLTACDQPTPEPEVVIDPPPTGPQEARTFPVPDAVQAVRRTTGDYRRLAAAEAKGYAAFGGCFADSVLGGMGYHFANDALVADSSIDALRPELMVYEPLRSGERRLAAVEYIVFVDEWHAHGHADPPALFGQVFHINPTLLPKPFYLLHVWLWKENPSGLFMDWNPAVSCEAP